MRFVSASNDLLEIIPVGERFQNIRLFKRSEIEVVKKREDEHLIDLTELTIL